MSGLRRWGVRLGAAFLAVVLLTLAVRGGRMALARWGSVTGGAEWIWVQHDRRAAQPLALYLARDFTLRPPLPPAARLLALGDPEYVLYLNGKRVGAGGWRPGARLDVYEVAGLLRPGGNRLLAEVRSADGDGGFLASLIDEADGAVLVASDGDWRSYRRHRLGLLRGWLPVGRFGPGPLNAAGTAAAGTAGPGEAALAWGRPPLGRWQHLTPGGPRPLFSALTAGRPPLPAAAALPFVPPAVSGVAADASMVLFDWGRPVAGYLALEPGYEPGMDPDLVPAPPNRQRTALVWTGDEPPRPAGNGQPPSANLVLMASAREWLDVRPRRFRYALVVGLTRPLAARVYPVDEVLAARCGLAIESGGRLEKGVFRLPAPRLRTPVEDEIRRKLKRLPGVAGREEL